MRYIKKVADNCKNCSVSFKDSPRYTNKRALCIPCFKKEASERRLENKKNNTPVYDKYRQFMKLNREPIHRQRAKMLKGIKEREQWLEFFKVRWEEIKSDQLLWEWLNRDTELFVRTKDRIKQSTYIKTTYDDYETEEQI